MRFYARDICIYALRELGERHFAETFFSCFRVARNTPLFPSNEEYEKLVVQRKYSFQLDVEKFEDEIYQIIQTSTPLTINIYFEQLKEYVNAKLIDQSALKQDFDYWHNEDPELFDQTKFDKYIEVINEITARFLDVANKHLKLYDAGKYSKSTANQSKQSKTRPTAPAIALFCNLINEAEIIKKEGNEIPEIYCKRICENYNLKYTDRVRQNFNGNKSKKHYKELTELILPRIDETTKDNIQKHLDIKNPPKQKLYA